MRIHHSRCLCITLSLAIYSTAGCGDPESSAVDGGPLDSQARDSGQDAALELGGTAADLSPDAPGDSTLPDKSTPGPLDRTGTLWRPYLEWSLKNATHGAKPHDLVATVTFTHAASSEKRTTGMFYAGAGVWKFRFTGTRAGLWTFKTTSADVDLDGKSGKVVLAKNPDPAAHGFLKKFGSKWGWQGTERAFVPQLVMYDHPGAYHKKPAKIDAAIKQFFQTHGFNGVHTIVMCRWFDINQTAHDKIKADPVPDPRTFEALELLITRVHAKGGMVHIWASG